MSALAAFLFAPSLSAQPISGNELDDLFDSEPQVEVNLSGSLLRLAAAATREDEPETSAMIEGLRRITVRIYPTYEGDRARTVRTWEDIGLRFEDAGWQTLIRVRSLPNDEDSDGDVWVYVRDEGDAFGGLAVMTVDDDEDNAVFVLIDGLIDPAQVGALTRRFGDVDLDVYDDDDV